MASSISRALVSRGSPLSQEIIRFWFGNLESSSVEIPKEKVRYRSFYNKNTTEDPLILRTLLYCSWMTTACTVNNFM